MLGSVSSGIVFIFVTVSGIKDGSCIDVAPDVLMDSLALVTTLRVCGLKMNQGCPLAVRLVFGLLDSCVTMMGARTLSVLHHYAL